jgi:hypothetical protein
MAADRDRSVEPAQSDIVKLQLRRLALESVLPYRQIRSLGAAGKLASSWKGSPG